MRCFVRTALEATDRATVPGVPPRRSGGRGTSSMGVCFVSDAPGGRPPVVATAATPTR